jgi:hypothetical protein
MPDFVLLPLIFVMAYLGFVFLALSQVQNWRRAVGAEACPKRKLRGIGYVLLAGNLIFSVAVDEASFGALVWITSMSVAALAVILTLTYRPGWLRMLATAFEFGAR